MTSVSVAFNSSSRILVQVDASSIGSVALSRLSSGSGGVVHSAFDGAVNILLSEGLVSVVPESVGQGPINITLRPSLDLSKLSLLGVVAGDPVTVRLGVLELGRCCRVNLGSSRTFSAERKLGLAVLSDEDLVRNLEVMRRTALASGNMAGLGRLIGLVSTTKDGSVPENLNMYASFALPRLMRLERGFLAQDKSAVVDAVRELVGLGPGLTPSSDDVLAGLVLTCLLYSQNSGLGRSSSRLLGDVIASVAPGRTTLLSQEHLLQAAAGRGNRPIMEACTALLTRPSRSVRRETIRVLGIGETSGTDVVLGIILAMKFCMGLRSGLEWRVS